MCPNEAQAAPRRASQAAEPTRLLVVQSLPRRRGVRACELGSESRTTRLHLAGMLGSPSCAHPLGLQASATRGLPSLPRPCHGPPGFRGGGGRPRPSQSVRACGPGRAPDPRPAAVPAAGSASSLGHGSRPPVQLSKQGVSLSFCLTKSPRGTGGLNAGVWTQAIIPNYSFSFEPARPAGEPAEARAPVILPGRGIAVGSSRPGARRFHVTAGLELIQTHCDGGINPGAPAFRGL